MGIESLTKSAEAAGYAMAQSDDPETEMSVPAVPRVERQGAANRVPQMFVPATPQLPAVRQSAPASMATQLVRSFWSRFGYGAPA